VNADRCGLTGATTFGVRDAGVLTQLELVATAARILRVQLRCANRDLDVRQLHRQVFGDVYAWAGEPRIVE
jgi:cell filamentation protein